MKLAKGLNFRMTQGFTFYNRNTQNLYGTGSYEYYQSYGQQTSADARSYHNYSWINTNILSYIREFNEDHRINATAVLERRYELNFAFRETEQFRIADQIVAVRVVVRKGNEDPDVVQQGGIVQQLARYGRGVVQPDGPRAVEQFKGQLRDVPGMFFLEAAEPCQLEDAFLAGGEAGTGLLRMRPHEVVDEDAVLQVAVADGHALESLLLHDGLEDGRARDDHVGPVGIDARNGFTLLKGAGTQFLDRAAQSVIAEDMLGSRGGFARARGALLLQCGGDFREVLGRA